MLVKVLECEKRLHADKCDAEGCIREQLGDTEASAKACSQLQVGIFYVPYTIVILYSETKIESTTGKQFFHHSEESTEIQVHCLANILPLARDILFTITYFSIMKFALIWDFTFFSSNFLVLLV